MTSTIECRIYIGHSIASEDNQGKENLLFGTYLPMKKIRSSTVDNGEKN